jgi:omega-hydroxy-beta-dihydromenaquinone-9 sulfotransferase
LTAADVFPWIAARMEETIKRRARAQRCALFTHKFTGWPRARFLASVFREAKFIHVVRDGRAVANSYLQMPWWTGIYGPDAWSLGPLGPRYAAEWEATGNSLVALAGIAWKILMDAHEAAEAQIDHGRWLTLRYEDVVSNPRPSFEKILAFVGLDSGPTFERGLARHHFYPDRRKAFHAELGPENVAVLEHLLVGHLQRYGYATS